MNSTSDFRLVGPLAGKFLKALQDSYTPDTFDHMLFTRLSLDRTDLTMAEDMPTRYLRVLNRANKGSWADKFVAAALDANPGSVPLRAFAIELGLDPVPASQAANLQKVVAADSIFHEAEPFRESLGARISWVCQVAVPNGGGTGLLIAPNLVLTNHHVIASVLDKTVSSDRVTCLFDFKQLANGLQLSPGRRVRLDSEWHVASRPHSPTDTVRNGGQPAPELLDYAIIRLATKVGEEPIGVTGGADDTAPARGWLSLSSGQGTTAKNKPLFVLQHPLLPGRRRQEPVQLSLGVVLESPFPQLRLRHDASTLPGSSGSPCFNADLELVALHHAGDSNVAWDPEWNQAIPIQNIVADLIARGVDRKLWEL